MGHQSQKLISTHAGNNRTQIFLESKYIKTANMDALTVVVGFKQRPTQKPLRGRDEGGVLGMVNQALCRLWVPPAPGAITSPEGQDECGSWEGLSSNPPGLILQSHQQKEKK